MPTTLADVRDRVRKDLKDTDAAAYRWPDSQLDRHIDRALTELSLAMPLEKTATLATTVDSRELSLASLVDLLEVEAVEYPVGDYPPTRAGFNVWAGVLFLQVDDAPTGADAKLFYTAKHTLDGGGTTLTPFQAEMVAMGAAAYAALEQAAYLADRVTTGGDAPERYAAWARARQTAFGQLLYQYGRRARLRPRRATLPA